MPFALSPGVEEIPRLCHLYPGPEERGERCGFMLQKSSAETILFFGIRKYFRNFLGPNLCQDNVMRDTNKI